MSQQTVSTHGTYKKHTQKKQAKAVDPEIVDERFLHLNETQVQRINGLIPITLRRLSGSFEGQIPLIIPHFKKGKMNFLTLRSR